jgi:hypothetical protein
MRTLPWKNKSLQDLFETCSRLEKAASQNTEPHETQSKIEYQFLSKGKEIARPKNESNESEKHENDSRIIEYY